NDTQAVLGQKVDGSERIIVSGKSITKRAKKFVYLAYHKPIGVICTSDPAAPNNIIDAVHFPTRVFHIGRLDVASSGLILLTDNGDVVNKILRAKGGNEKEYVVTIDQDITPHLIRALSRGIEIFGRKTLPAKISQVNQRTFHITLTEGRNRQIRRMCEALHVEVVSLKRIRVMNVELGDLPLGKWRHLTPIEEKTVLQMLH
ncbi:MAG TPA: pseudouridine synthase, partial [Patescibacteria group bacterium]|nr:pseudouridine synthase [Patescibacteria group bacterium]